MYQRYPKYQEGIKYFFNNQQALAYYIESGTPDGGSQPQVVLNFAKIYNEYKNGRGTKTIDFEQLAEAKYIMLVAKQN